MYFTRFCFFKQKTAYERRISDWSADVCSSDLRLRPPGADGDAFMQTGFRTVLSDRGVLALTGEDRYGFLQGLVSNDVERARGDRAVYAALLTAQGRFLHDFFLVRSGDALLLDCEAERRDDLRVRLSRYRLRAKVAVEDRTE